MKTIIVILATLLITSTSAFAQPDNQVAPSVSRITISQRCDQLQINCTKPILLDLGRRLEPLYVSRHNEKPPQQRGVNIYTTTDIDLIDQAIINQLVSQNEKLRQELDSQKGKGEKG